MQGLLGRISDGASDDEAKSTIIILAECSSDTLPKRNDVIYFEFPNAIGKLSSLSSEVHIYLFHKLPGSPKEALAMLGHAHASFWCRTMGLEDDRGGVELNADWYIDGRIPQLNPAPPRFRPARTRGTEQVRVKAYSDVRGKFEYLFSARSRWQPILDDVQTVRSPNAEVATLISPDFLDNDEWFLVSGLTVIADGGGESEDAPKPQRRDRREAALRQLSPEGGSFILFSRRRRQFDRVNDRRDKPSE